MGAAEKPFISVVILTADRREALERCLRSLTMQEYSAFEVIVVDNGSTDGTREWLAEQEMIGDLRMIEGNPNASFAEARNLGAEHAVGSIIAFIDDDCEAHAGWLTKIGHHLTHGFDAIGGLCIPPHGMAFPRWWHPSLGWTVGFSGPEHRNPDLAGSLAYPQTANMALRREVWREERFQDIGGVLDGSDKIYRWGREDAELWRRLRLHGWRTKFDPDLMVTHHIDPARLSWRYIRRRSREDGRSLWHREREMTQLRHSLGDVLAWPARFVKCFAAPASQWLPNLAAASIWRRRQMAFVMACLGERGFGGCARPILGTLKHWIGGMVKRLLRGPLWLALACFRVSVRRKLPVNPGHIVIACQGFLGDTILISPMLAAVRERWPAAKITLLTNRHGREIHGANSHIDSLVEISPVRFLFGWERWKETRRTLRALKPDVVIAPYWHGTPAWPLLISHSAPVIGFDGDMGFRRRIWHDLLDREVPKDCHLHEIENLLRLASALGAVETPEGITFPAPHAPTPHVTKFFEESGLRTAPFIAVHIDAVGEGKGWSDDRWGSLFERMQIRWPQLKLVFIGLARHRPRIHRIIDDHNLSAISACGNRPIGDLAEILRRAHLLVTTDSGPKHLAVALGTPTVTLYGNSSAVRWGAWRDGEKHIAVVSPGWDLRPEELGSRSVEHKMALIKVGQVEDAIEQALER